MNIIVRYKIQVKIDQSPNADCLTEWIRKKTKIILSLALLLSISISYSYDIIRLILKSLTMVAKHFIFIYIHFVIKSVEVPKYQMTSAADYLAEYLTIGEIMKCVT